MPECLLRDKDLIRTVLMQVLRSLIGTCHKVSGTY